MVKPFVFLGFFDSDNVGRTFDDADNAPVSFRVFADRAFFAVGEVLTFFAVMYRLFRVKNRVCKVLRLFFGQAQNMESEPLGGLCSDTGKTAEFVY